jgi:NitT/TauT family transport system permease protein
VRRPLFACLFFLALLGAWEALFRARVWSEVLLPSPLSVAKYLWRSVEDGTLEKAALVTSRRLALGYLMGVCVGLPLGFLTARYRAAADTLGVLALGLQTLPSVCWVPLALQWFGQSETAMLFVVVMGTVWCIAIATDGGVRSIPPIYARAARTMGSKEFHSLVHVTLPAALPWVVSGMKQGWAFAWRSLMAAEIYVTIMDGIGLGHLLHYGRELHAMDQVLGVMLVIVGVGLLADRLVFFPAEKWLRRRWGVESRR